MSPYPTSLMHKPIVICKLSDLRDNGMALGLYCLECDRWGEIQPAKWLADGNKDVNYVTQKFTCQHCGGQAQKQVRSQAVTF